MSRSTSLTAAVLGFGGSPERIRTGVAVLAELFKMMGWGGDVRVLKAQLDLSAQAVQATRFTAPLWSLLVALLCSDVCGLFGHQSLIKAFYLPMIVSLTIVFSTSLTAVYLRRTAGITTFPEIKRWFLRLAALQVGVSLS